MPRPPIKPDHDQIYCSKGAQCPCPLQVNDGYCAAEYCQFQVWQKEAKNETTD